MKHATLRLSVISLFVFAFALLLASFTIKHLKFRHHTMDDPATHNMLIVGEKTAFLSHLPMFQEKNAKPMPHRYQAIFEVSFEKPGDKPDDQYFIDRKSHPKTKIYTLNPEAFVLPLLVSPDSTKQIRKFKATIFRGHLEKDGSELLKEDVRVKQVVHFREFDPATKRAAQLEYILFGKGSELFLAHFIKGPPDFDQVLSVNVSGRQFTDTELAKGLKVVFKGSKNTPATRLKEKQKLDGEVLIGDTLKPVMIQVVPARELYFEEGELRVPAVFDATAEEKKAGFP